MAKRYTRKEVINRLRDQVKKGKPILMFGAGIGLTAKSAEIGGADIIAVYSTAIYRMRGLPTLMAFMPYSDANEHVREMAREILPAVKEVPCIVGIGAHDPTLNRELFLDEMMSMGFSGVTNEPFTVGWAFNPLEARKMAEAGADVVGALVGVTVGGLTGAKKSLSLDEATAAVQAMCDEAKKVNPEVMVLSHGGPFKDPETAEYSIVHTDAVGYAAGSSGERMPTEKAVSEVTAMYKTMKLGKK